MRRCITLPVLVFLSCSTAIPVMAAGRHGHAQQNRAHKAVPPRPGPTQVLPPTPPPTGADTQAGPADDDISADVLLKGLPPSWQAKVLDTPLPPPQSDSRTARAGKPGTTTARAGGNTTSGSAGQMASSVSRVLLPVPPDMGIAAFRSGNTFIIVVDNAQQMDTSALRGDGIFSALTVDTLPEATLIKVRLPDTRKLYLSQQAEGWVLGDKPPPDADYADRRMIIPRQVDGGILYPMRRPGRVLSIDDPASGTRLLVGTSTTDDGGILSLRKGDGYDVWPTTEGVVVAAHAPDIGMHATSDGALLTRDGKAFADSGAAVYASDVDLKWLGLRNLPVPELETRWRKALVTAADATPVEEFDRRLDAARAAFAIGSFVEARGILTVALQDDPGEAARPEVRFLLAASELLSGNTEGASMLEGPWAENEQRALQLWRGLYLALGNRQGPEAAHMLARDFARIENYPQPVRDTLLPIAAEEIGRYGSREDLAVLDKLPSGSLYQVATAFRDLRLGKRDQAYATFRKLTMDKDPVVAEKALEQTISIDLADGRMKPEAAAEAFAGLIPDARLAGREAVVRLLQADAHMRAGRWSDALAAIDKAQAGDKPAPESVATPMLFQTLEQIARSTPDNSDKEVLLHNAAVLRAHLPDLPPGARKAEIMTAYGRMLRGLGLPDEAAQVLSDTIPMLESPLSRATAGEELAGIQLERHQPQDALDVLNRTDDASLPDDVKASRRLVSANAALAMGDSSKAISILNTDADPSSLDMLAHIHESKAEWPAAVAALRKLAQLSIPETGELTPTQQALALRMASDASQASDRGALHWISHRIGTRPMDPDNDRLFKLLTRRVGDAASASAGLPATPL